MAAPTFRFRGVVFDADLIPPHPPGPGIVYRFDIYQPQQGLLGGEGGEQETEPTRIWSSPNLTDTMGLSDYLFAHKKIRFGFAGNPIDGRFNGTALYVDLECRLVLVEHVTGDIIAELATDVATWEAEAF